ncbi:MAG: hypothetical protein C5B50_01845 [Verrucomicrobia bacterium]|nr:MAG: hypothetical protein C5B50_01845 [Verrucomicrobiota bacterium]
MSTQILCKILKPNLPLKRSAWSSQAMLSLALASLALRASCGSWAPVNQTFTNRLGLMLLLSDGSVMVQEYGGRNWFRLSPDAQGSYVHGTWTTMASMHDTRDAFSSVVLRDGRVFVAGGEYGSGASSAELYNPLKNTWTYTRDLGVSFTDSMAKILPDGSVLVAPNGLTQTCIYHPDSNRWTTNSGILARQNEASWVKLPDQSILTVDPGSLVSERYIPSLGRWISDATVPTNLWIDLPGYGGGEIGPALLLPNGKAFFLGGTSHTALYIPSGSTNPGTWMAGPDIWHGLSAADAPAAMMVNGKILCAVADPPYVQSGQAVFPSPTSFVEYDPDANSFSPVSGPPGDATGPPQASTMLDLPDGTVLLSDTSDQLYIYDPQDGPRSAAIPTISSVGWSDAGSLHLAGTRFNGISEGAAFGDDAQMDSNYPLARFADDDGNLQYGRTYNWSDTGVLTGDKIVSTDAAIDWALLRGAGPYSLSVVANGASSLPVSFNPPIWLDYSYPGPFRVGTYSFPYNSLSEALDNVSTGGAIAIKPGGAPETLTITKPVKLFAVGGPVTIGR